MLEKIEIIYNRNKGFKLIDELQKPLSQEAFDMVKAHANSMEKDSRLREVTHKLIIRIVLIIALIVLIILLVLANLLSALICFSILVALCYFLAILQAKKLNKLTLEYDLKITGSDWEYFGCRIENKFGKKSWKFYAWIPFINPTISLIIYVLKRPEIPKLSLSDIDNGLIIGKLNGMSKSSTSQPAIKTPQQIPQSNLTQGKPDQPKKKISIPMRSRASVLPPLNIGQRRYKEDIDDSIDLGNHGDSVDKEKNIANEKLFD